MTDDTAAGDALRERVEALEDARDALYRGEGPDLMGGSDIVYGEWLGNRAARIAAATTAPVGDAGEVRLTLTTTAPEFSRLDEDPAASVQMIEWHAPKTAEILAARLSADQGGTSDPDATARAVEAALDEVERRIDDSATTIHEALTIVAEVRAARGAGQ